MKKKILPAVCSACAAAVFALSGCQVGNRIGHFYLTDRSVMLAAAGNSTALTAPACSLIFLNTQSLYNRYYENAGMTSFWSRMIPADGAASVDSSAAAGQEESAESTRESASAAETGDENTSGQMMSFADYIKNGRVRNEVAALILLGDYAAENGISLTEEEKNRCSAAAVEYYGTLSDAEKEYTGASESDVNELYTSYRLAQDVIRQMTADAYLDISDNDRRVIDLQILCVSDADLADQLHEDLVSGADFTRLAKEYSLLDQTEYAVSRGELNPVLEETAFLLDNDEVSEVIPADGVYYVIRCLDDFNETESAKNENRVLDLARYSQWSRDVVQSSGNETVLFLDSYWDSMTFAESDELTADCLYTIYQKAFPEDEEESSGGL